MNIIKKLVDRYFSKEREKEISIEETVKQEKPVYKNLIADTNNNTVKIILSDGSIIYGKYEKEEDLETIKTLSREEIIELVTPKITKEAVKQVNSDEEIAEIETKELLQDVNLLSQFEEFEVVNSQVYLKGIRGLAIPKPIVAEFLRILKDDEDAKYFDSLLMFTFRLMLNPVQSAREDCLNFVKKNNIPITENGLLVTFRKVVSVGKTNKNLVKFVSENYLRLKRQKKGTKNYEVFKKDDMYTLVHLNKNHLENGDFIGNLNELYHKPELVEENTFTDSHTRTKDIKIGQIYKEDENKVDLDNTKDCSRGLHSGSLSFGEFNDFGDTGVICLVDPIKVRSVPVSNCYKMRSSELFPVAIVDFNTYKEFVETEEIVNFENLYSEATLETLKEAIKNKTFEPLSCQEETPDVTIKEVSTIVNTISNKRVVKF
jgi:hypothetical protein